MSIIAAMHTRFASASDSSYIGMANGRSSLTREPPTHSAAAKLPWHTVPITSVRQRWIESLGSRAYLAFDRSGFSTCVQSPPLNIRYLLATGTMFNRF
ncbi:hypothetical protein E4T50_09611 [Aureobasidium sp. EXF-12298]|nr:hypothetical protein E4T50_09611 [Aureobasidium sp. EXF-12298]KAI4757638.1 hypothetical protein E4T51_09320 [Aureobasidium sp. EXF-12344]KAI4774676.1 hypothetical protein E4T52_10373 [Aureobasidium sp. EXF-3400]